MTVTDPSPTVTDQAANASKRQRNWRKRRACGIRLLTIAVREDILADAMIESGRCTPAEAMDSDILAREVSNLVGEWCERWRG